MTIVYFDSSALVKLLVEEDGSDLAATLWDGCDAAVASRLAYPEVRAAIAVARRDRRLTAADQRHAEAAFGGYWAATRMVELTYPVAERAGQLATDHALRGSDAVHLASVLSVGAEQVLLAVWDRRLRSAARAAGVLVVPAE